MRQSTPEEQICQFQVHFTVHTELLFLIGLLMFSRHLNLLHSLSYSCSCCPLPSTKTLQVIENLFYICYRVVFSEALYVVIPMWKSTFV